MNNRTKAALIGGALAGVLSGLPIISGCCFLWAIGGGFLAVFMYLKDAPPGPLEMGDAAKLGALAGAIGAVISIVLGLPFMLLGIGASAVQNSDLQSAGISSGIMAVGGIVGLLLRAALVVGFAALGGVIGAAVLGKNRPGGVGTPPPPPPSDFGGGYGGGTTPPADGGYGGTTPPAGGPSGSFGSGS
ncbi:MAG: hypothetical protein LC800_01135 [Acidobacteria bacterium]|nr:hypothetical protein [Acidobacteriota bacterium]